jgi:hypothetical protein
MTCIETLKEHKVASQLSGSFHCAKIDKKLYVFTAGIALPYSIALSIIINIMCLRHYHLEILEQEKIKATIGQLNQDIPRLHEPDSGIWLYEFLANLVAKWEPQDFEELLSQ